MKEIQNVYKEFGKAMVKKRCQMGLTTKALSDILGMNRISLANMEAGRQRVMFQEAVIIAKTLNMKLEPFKKKL